MTAPVTSTRVGLKYPKTDRVRRRFEYLAAQKSGRRVHTTHFVLILAERADGRGPRLGVTASRKSGNSVLRHRVRRLLREVFRLHRDAFPSGHDIVVLLRENTPPLDYATVRDEVLSALSRSRNRGRPPSAKASSSPNAGRSAAHPERDGGRS
jgi:ribonuclease P protein component